jgi:trans-aconitate 2-methyltransferase
MGQASQPREWDAVTYDALPLPHQTWGARLLARLPLRGDETVLDVGAGTGRDTEALLARLPRGHVIAVDGSAAMLEQLGKRLAGSDRLTVKRADLREPLELERTVDAVFSVATLHWLPDHDAVFRSLAPVLRPGGLLRIECGGAGNVAEVDRAVTNLGFASLNRAFRFADTGDTEASLAAAGFTDIEVKLVPDPARLQPGAQLESFLATVVLGPVLDPLEPGERPEVVRRVAAQLPRPEVDYVRLQMSATRAS